MSRLSWLSALGAVLVLQGAVLCFKKKSDKGNEAVLDANEAMLKNLQEINSQMHAEMEEMKAQSESMQSSMELRMGEMRTQMRNMQDSMEAKLEAGAGAQMLSNSISASPALAALLSRAQGLNNNSNGSDVAAHCKSKPRVHARPQPILVEQNLRDNKTKAHSEDTSEAHGHGVLDCAAGILLTHFSRDSRSSSCCPAQEVSCAGCALYADGKCKHCHGGYLQRQGRCTACSDEADWVNEELKSCVELTAHDCNNRPVNGKSSNQACCQCNGGQLSAIPFSYPSKRWSLGAPIQLQPSPRTATKYSLNVGCNLPKYNITLDGATGVISYLHGKNQPEEPFSVECEVTAHETDQISLTVPVVVAADHFTYSSSTLVFSEEVPSFKTVTSGGLWSQFSLACAPEAPWLHMAAASGDLTLSKSSSKNGGSLTDVGSGTFLGVQGALCVATGWHQKNATAEKTQKVSRFVAISPRPWAALAYESSVVEVVIGEESQPLKLKSPAEASSMLRPSSYNIACEVMGSLSTPESADALESFVFDASSGVGVLGGHQVLELSSDGQISIAPSPYLAKVFDAVEATGTARRKSVQLQCGVWGLFPGTPFAPIMAKLSIVLKDSICWAPATFPGQKLSTRNGTSLQACRSMCRMTRNCAYVAYQSYDSMYNTSDDGGDYEKRPGGLCVQYRIAPLSETKVTADARITGCEDLSTCLSLGHPTWVLAGVYCPLGFDVRRDSVVYRKDSDIPEEVMYLSRGGCTGDGWKFQRSNPRSDAIDVKLGYYGLEGEELLCLPNSLPTTSKNGSLNWYSQPCGQPVFPESLSEQLQKFTFDDPSTPQPQDFWLHPCDCLPPAWGPEWPANPESFEDLPPGSDGSFVPPPLGIVGGQFVCPPRQLLPGAAGVHFMSETEAAEPTDCQERCNDYVNCTFFWHGTSHGASTCRLYSGCDSLVREFGLEGELLAMPRERSCMVANPEACWKTTLRRNFLTRLEIDKASSTGAMVHNTGGKTEFEKLKSKNLSSAAEYVEKLGEMSKIKLTGWNKILKGFGYARDVAGIATFTVEGLSAGQIYEYSIAQRTTLNPVENTFKINGGQPIPVTQQVKSKPFTGKVKATGRGQLIFEVETPDHPFNINDIEGAVNSYADCGRQQVVTSCQCWSVTGLCAGAKVNGSRCTVYGKVDVAVEATPTRRRRKGLWLLATVGSNSRRRRRKSPVQPQSVVHAQARCMDLHFAKSTRVITSSEDMNSRLTKQTKATCPSGSNLLSCSCFPDHCKKVWHSKRTCYAKGGGRVQAICANIPSPAAVDWKVEIKRVQLAPNISDIVQCPGGYTLTGCSCSSFGDQQDHCNRVRGKINGCEFGIGARSAPQSQEIEVRAFCVKMKTAFLTLTDISVQKPQEKSLLQLGEPSQEKKPDFLYLHLHEQCDTQLLLGGLGVEHCSRPSYRQPDMHQWKQKVRLPGSFKHGSQLQVGCWTERYSGIRGAVQASGELMTCVNGDWYNSRQLPELAGFSCEPCLQVGSSGFSTYMKKQKQELYFFNAMSLRVYTELSSLLLASSAVQKYCFGPGEGRTMILTNNQQCPDTMVAETVPDSASEERVMRLLGEKAQGQCLHAAPGGDGSAPSVVHVTCSLNDTQQLISPGALPSMLWTLHRDDDRAKGQDLHRAHFSSCGAHGALRRFSFGQMFGGYLGGAKSSCHFAPVLRFGGFVPTPIIQDRLSSEWPDWYHVLADSPILCEHGEALTGFKLNSVSKKYEYECSRIGGMGISFEYFSAQVEVAAFLPEKSKWLRTMNMLLVDCGEDGMLSGFHFEFSEGGRWARARYTCSKAGGVPVVIEAGHLVHAMISSSDGVYCPTAKSPFTGRFKYENFVSGDELIFQDGGAWCLGGKCSQPVGGASPLGIVTPDFEVKNVTDFDGVFEAKGVPDMGMNFAAGLAAKLKALKPPKLPKLPKKPKLQEFKAEQPTYAENCLDYQELWKGISETYTDANDQEISEEGKLEADPMTKGAELPDYHPCAVARSAGGIFGKIGEGDGKTAPENMMYADWNNCMQGDIERDLKTAKLAFSNTIHDLTADIIQKGTKLKCAAIPSVEIAPMGAGSEVKPDQYCDKSVDYGRSLNDFGKDNAYSAAEYLIEEEGYAACNPLQIGFARAFCDIHCVRDAVIRGDRTIIRNLEKATKISNDNMNKMVEWSADQSKVYMEYLDKKIDHSLQVNTIYLQHIASNTQPKPESLVDTTVASVGSMLQELSGFAQAASFGQHSRHSANDALETFVRNAVELPTAESNRTAVALQTREFQFQLDSLHRTLHSISGGISKSELVGRQLAHEVQVLQQQARRQREVLGIYRLHARASHDHGPRAGHAVLTTLDHLWWQIRDELDQYLDTADDEVRRFQKSFAAMSHYEGCELGFSELLQSYATSMAAMTESHRQLAIVWRKTSNLLGELAATISDGDMMQTFVSEEGCDSSLAKQTLKQARLAFEGMGMLLHRFKMSGLQEPSRIVMTQAAQTIDRAYEEARKGCVTE